MRGPCNVQVSGYVPFRQLADEQEPDPTLTPFQAFDVVSLRCARLIWPFWIGHVPRISMSGWRSQRQLGELVIKHQRRRTDLQAMGLGRACA